MQAGDILLLRGHVTRSIGKDWLKGTLARRGQKFACIFEYIINYENSLHCYHTHYILYNSYILCTVKPSNAGHPNTVSLRIPCHHLFPRFYLNTVKPPIPGPRIPSPLNTLAFCFPPSGTVLWVYCIIIHSNVLTNVSCSVKLVGTSELKKTKKIIIVIRIQSAVRSIGSSPS